VGPVDRENWAPYSTGAAPTPGHLLWRDGSARAEQRIHRDGGLGPRFSRPIRVRRQARQRAIVDGTSVLGSTAEPKPECRQHGARAQINPPVPPLLPPPAARSTPPVEASDISATSTWTMARPALHQTRLAPVLGAPTAASHAAASLAGAPELDSTESPPRVSHTRACRRHPTRVA